MFRKLFLAALLAAISIPALAGGRTIEMTVDGLVCAFCAQGIDKKLRKLDATQDVYVSLENKLVAVGLKPDLDLADEDLRQALTEAGYSVRAITRTERSLDQLRKREPAKP